MPPRTRRRPSASPADPVAGARRRGSPIATIMTYLDYNATAPLRPEAATALAEAAAAVGNPSSVHRFGRDRRRRIEDAREQVAALVGAAPGQIVFTSGGTEANQLALRGAFAGRPARL